MNIVLVTPWKLSDINGVSKAVTMLSCEFQKKGHGITVLLPQGENTIGPIETVDNIVVQGIYLRLPYSDIRPLRAFVSFWLFLPSTLYQLFRFLSRLKVDVVEIQFPLANMFYFAILRLVSRWKFVVVYQGSDAHLLDRWSAMDRRLVKGILRTADCVVAVSQTLHDKVAAVFPDLKLKKTCVVPNGAPLDKIARHEFSEPAGTLPADYILSVGHLIRRKGFDVVIDALRLVREQGVTINLVVAGEGEERESLIRLADQCGVRPNVHLLGSQSHEQVLTLMKRSLFFVLASRAEGLPLVVAEAMACGKTVVATNVDGTSEIVEDGRTGILVPPENAPALAAAVMKLYTDSATRDAFAREARDRALREYNWEAIANRHLNLFGVALSCVTSHAAI